MGIVRKVGSAVKMMALRKLPLGVERLGPFSVTVLKRPHPQKPYSALDKSIFMDYSVDPVRVHGEKNHVRPEEMAQSAVRLALTDEWLGPFGVTTLSGGEKMPDRFMLDSEFADSAPSFFARVMNKLWPVYDRLLGKEKK